MCLLQYHMFVYQQIDITTMYSQNLKYRLNATMIYHIILFCTQIVANYGVGVNQIDIKGLNRKGIKVSNCPDGSSNTVADHGMALLLASARNIIPGMFVWH